MNPQLTCSQRQWLHSSVGRASHRYREVTGSNPVEVLNFFQASLRNCINCVNCDNHFFISNLRRLVLFAVALSEEASLVILIVGNKLLCSYRDTCLSSACDHSTLLGHPSWIEATSSDAMQMRMNTPQHILERLQNANSWHCTVITSVISVRITITSHYSKCSTLFPLWLHQTYKKITKKKVCRLQSFWLNQVRFLNGN